MTDMEPKKSQNRHRPSAAPAQPTGGRTKPERAGRARQATRIPREVIRASARNIVRAYQKAGISLTN